MQIRNAEMPPNESCSLHSAGPNVGLELACVLGRGDPFPSSTTTLRGDETGCMFFRLDLGLKVLKRVNFREGKKVLGKNSSSVQGQTILEKNTMEYLPRLAEQSEFIQASESEASHSRGPPTLERVLNDLAS